MKKPILFVDDDPVALRLVVDIFRKQFGDAFSYQRAFNAEEAEEILMEDLAKKGTLPVLIVSDWIMPGKRGDVFLTDLAEQYPEIALVMHSGLADADLERRLKQSCRLVACIQKPWDGKQHLKAIEQVLTPAQAA